MSIKAKNQNEAKKRKKRRRAGCLAGMLSLVLLVCGGCGKKGGQEGEPALSPTAAGLPEGNTAPTGTAGPDDTALPSGEGTLSGEDVPANTITPAGALTPEPTSPGLIASGNMPGVIVTDGLPVVTPVPQSAVADIAGSIAPEAYPVVDGSTATLPLSKALYQLATGADAEAAERAIAHTKTTNSYYRLYDGEADLLIVYEPPQEIIDRMKEEALLVKPIGLDALVFMANAANPVVSLTTEQLVDIYAGRIKNWSEVGGADDRLLAFQRPAGSGSQTLMQKLVMGDTPMEEGDNVVRYHSMSDILEGMISYTGEDNTLGYSVFYYANFMYSLPELRFMGVNGVLPSTQTIYDGTYPFVNAFYAVIRPDEAADSSARRLFDWLTGEAGQQLVLDLGYVPVIMPAGGQPGEKAPVPAQEIAVTPQKKLAPGEHYIFCQRELTDWDEGAVYGSVKIYDENWNCCASFEAAACNTPGVTSDRYISIYRWQPESEDDGDGTEDGTGAADDMPENEELSHIYDLAEHKFVEFEGISGNRIYSIKDGKKGYFELGPDWSNENEFAVSIIDREGNTLVDGIMPGESGGMLENMGGYYKATYWANWLDGNREDAYKIFDLDFHLKSILYCSEEDMPAEEERLPGVAYELVKDGWLLSPEGDVLLNAGRFLEVFGNGTDTDCVIEYGWEIWDYSENQLYRVEYAGTKWYVDKDLNVFLREGDRTLSFRDREKADALYYMAYIDGSGKYFAPDGEMLAFEMSGQMPEEVYPDGNESYLMVREAGNSYQIEEVVPSESYREFGQYSSSRHSYSAVEYCGKYMFVLHGRREEDRKTFQNITIVRGSNVVDLIEAEELYFWQCVPDWRTQEREDFWIAESYDGDTLSVPGVEEQRRLYTYVFYSSEKGLCFSTREPGELISCGRGYVQLDIGSYSYVYDYDGNQIIKAYHPRMMED
ncbi:MAG: substrate-binding domain-containing protein [Lachnospiraceae bacterium]|nr:substrate-binding domain-containing protein [Lachnospiraceae bacterium]